MLYDLLVVQFERSLRNMTLILNKAVAYSEHKKFDINVLLNSRLAPDQFNFTRQIQILCDTAKFGAARITGKEAPSFEDNETTVDQLKTRIDKTLNYLRTFQPKDFDGASVCKVTTPRWEGKYLFGTEYASQHVIPNFYFHMTTAYAILRHNGVDIGKKDFLGELTFKA